MVEGAEVAAGFVEDVDVVVVLRVLNVRIEFLEEVFGCERLDLEENRC